MDLFLPYFQLPNSGETRQPMQITTGNIISVATGIGAYLCALTRCNLNDMDADVLQYIFSSKYFLICVSLK